MGIQFQRRDPITPPQTYQLKLEDYFGLVEPQVLRGNIVDIEKQEIYQGCIHIVDGRISKIERCAVLETHYILPGLIDAHVHVESSMLTPASFANEAVKHGVVAAVCDPHEIANVMGEEGIEFMIDSAKQSDFKFFFGAPSCVPATPVETSGAKLDAAQVEQLLQRDDIYFLAEMMNYPGVVGGDPEVMKKLAAAKKLGKPVDGHVPGLSGDELKKYVAAGISTDHECIDTCEAEEKIHLGMKISIREGSAAKNFDMLYPLINRYPSSVMLCTDDCHPHELLQGYMLSLLKKGLDKGLGFFNLLRTLTSNVVNHYRLPVGLLQVNQLADCIVVDNIDDLTVLQTYINGKKVFDNTENSIKINNNLLVINNFKLLPIAKHEIIVPAKSTKIRIIELINNELYTKQVIEAATIVGGQIVADPKRDLLKIVVLNRYVEKAVPAVGFIRGFGLHSGTLCSSVAHDSHNLLAVGADDDSLAAAINAVIAHKGGIACCDEKGRTSVLPLPVAGLMSTAPAAEVAQQYELLQQHARE